MTTKKPMIVFHDRYSATGKPRPNHKTVCLGRCEGMGCFPSNKKEDWPPGAVPDEIGYVFVKCTACNGTGLRPGALS